jgi:hypothetical protein
MSSYVEITLWGGLPAPKKEAVEVVDTFLLHPSFSIMGADIPAQTFFDVLSECQTTNHLWSVIDSHLALHATLTAMLSNVITTLPNTTSRRYPYSSGVL